MPAVTITQIPLSIKEIKNLSRDEKEDLVEILEEKKRRANGKFIDTLFPEEGKLSRHAYPKHMEFFAAGAKYRERMAIAANRVGKTLGLGGYEVTLHLTGNYPSWWIGKRFDKPINAWACGDTSKTVRDILQKKLLGEFGSFGTGLIPLANMGRTTPKQGISDAIELVYVKHKSGGFSVLNLKSYDQGRQSFQGTEQHVIWPDEEPPLNIYTECVLRTMKTESFEGGIIISTFTPLMGLTETVLSFLPGGAFPEAQDGSRFVMGLGWDDAPHLSEEEKKVMLAAIPAFQRDARTKGLPQLGAGAIYPVAESEIVIDDFEIPEHWRRAYALDVGWNRTAALWGALNPETEELYLYSEHYQAHAEPAVHAQSIKSRGEWIPGVIDPASRGRSQRDGQQLIEDYNDLGLHLTTAINTREAGIYSVWTRLSGGKIKVFKSLKNFLGEYRVYRRDEKGNIVKENDHLMDDMRYLVMSGLDVAKVKPVAKKIGRMHNSGSAQGWMSA